MITLDHPQGSAEWIRARLGKPTASNFDRIITPKTRKPGASADKYMWQLLAEWLSGQSLDEYVSQYMERGTEMEEQAVRFYELQRDVETQLVGFCLRDDGLVGASPDRMVGDDGLLEIKCPALVTHIGYLLNPDGLDAYNCQAQGQLWITGRQWVDLLSYNPEMPPSLVRYHRDEEFIAALEAAVNQFIERLAFAKERLIALGCTPAEARNQVAWSDAPLEVTP